jgi:Holliday junction resolvasome RuvABC endonuclease subunit
MTNLPLEKRIIMAVFPSTRGFGYVVFKGPYLPIDWGIKHVSRDKNAECLAKVADLFEWYHPDTVVLEDYRGRASRRTKRIERLIESISDLAQQQRMETYSYSRAAIRNCFAAFGAGTKQEIAQAIAEQLPELGTRLPPVRKIWMSEDPRMSIFDAAALAITFLDTKSGSQRAA